jgi:RNA polymerase sigma factor (sigma-70 family)
MSSVDLQRALAGLPFDQRVMVVLRYLADRSERDVAQLLQVPVGTVKSRLTRGVAALSRELAAPSPEEGE